MYSFFPRGCFRPGCGKGQHQSHLTRVATFSTSVHPEPPTVYRPFDRRRQERQSEKFRWVPSEIVGPLVSLFSLVLQLRETVGYISGFLGGTSHIRSVQTITVGCINIPNAYSRLRENGYRCGVFFSLPFPRLCYICIAGVCVLSWSSAELRVQ